ncbi:hypothetical protein [Brevibacillus migulae]|uniref:hypothetical protein n=1 Tax=Brevibacillus migulae TaxID=1644114 RepID=UPI00106DEA74|nr:hypothetical protein [Brevibacillus migulae]
MYKDKKEYHFKKAAQYQMLAAFYEHKDPHKHIHYYKKHFYHENQFVRYAEKMKMRRHWHDSSSC